MVPRALVRALIAVFPGASSPLPTPACGAAARDAGSLCHRWRRAPVAFSRSGSLTVWARAPFPGRERPILVRQAPLYFLPVSPVGGDGSTATWWTEQVMERQAPGPIASSSRSGLVRLCRPRELNRPTNIAGCESVKGLEQLFSQLLEQPGVAHFAGVGSGGGVASVGGRD